MQIKERLVWIGIGALLLGGILLVSSFSYDTDSFRRFVLQSLSISLFPVGFIVLLDRFYLRHTVIGEVTSELSKALYRHFDEYGVKILHPQFDYDLIFNEAPRGAEIIILDTYIPTFAGCIPSMKRALQRECKVKFLVIDKNSEVAEKRALEIAEEGFDKNAFDSQVDSYIRMIAVAAQSVNATDRVFVTRYDDLPCMPIYLIKQARKSKAYFSFFLHTASIYAPHFEVNYTEQGLFRLFEDYLTQKWDRNVQDTKKVVELEDWIPKALGSP